MPSEYLADIIDHKQRVANYLRIIANDLFKRAAEHDNSKFSPEEFEAYEKAFPGLQKYAYGTPEFKAELRKIKPAIEHHYAHNRHHPEHYKNGINDMNLSDMMEMGCDWLAASSRSKTGLEKGLLMNKERFGIGDQMFGIIQRTIIDLTKDGEGSSSE